ncbi:septation protein A [Roseospira marina]|uniref:Inner membrane-spanning protein YciB n=1 Tax=Roseospira marina TaxID=140057 RepID=A0A5M6I8R8_9PROT|nr:septation protein A [Roseospira marina]KAA5604654.1 septation protein A [Roseospira marina]MBB4315098.1 intracellular septation protein [Roseospira marina]MBB5088132.1 intracellular septation protein [Roseospira marina]
MSAAPASPPPSPSSPPPETGAGDGQWLKLVLEAGPLLVFFLSNAWFGLIPGTAAFIVATAISLVASRVLMGRVPIMPLVGAVFVFVFGGLTVLLEDDLFIKIKPTIVNLLFAGLLTAGLMTGRHFLKLVFDGAFHLTDRGWTLLTVRWIGFFLVLAALNEVVWRGFSSDTWVTFKVFGILPLTLVFSLAQVPLLMRHKVEDAPPASGAGG